MVLTVLRPVVMVSQAALVVPKFGVPVKLEAFILCYFWSRLQGKPFSNQTTPGLWLPESPNQQTPLGSSSFPRFHQWLRLPRAII